MAVVVTETNITARNAITTVTSNPATADTDALAEVFTIETDSASLLIIIGGTGSSAVADMSYSFAVGQFWNKELITGTVTKDTEKVICVDTANCKQINGTILLTLTPGSSDKLLTDHGAYVKVIENVG